MQFECGRLCQAGHITQTQPLSGAFLAALTPRSYLCLTSVHLQEVARDLALLPAIADHIRIYSISACPASTAQILDFARANGMTVHVGIWISHGTTSNERVSGNCAPQRGPHGLHTTFMSLQAACNSEHSVVLFRVFHRS